MYSPHVRPGGLIAFHDINESSYVTGNQVHRFWRELKASHETREYIDQNWPGGGMGIGVVQWFGKEQIPIVSARSLGAR